MKILFVWTGVTSYMADCWRELSVQPEVELKVVVEAVASGSAFNAEKVLAGFDHVVVDKDDITSALAFVGTWRAEVIFAVGWHSRIVRAFVKNPDWRSGRKVCCFDLPWDGSLRRTLARWVLRPFLRHYDAAYVPGAACERYAKWLGFRKIFKGLFAIDTRKFAAEESLTDTRRAFLYLGRFSPEKRLDVLVSAYRRYRELGGIWPLDLYGAGELPRELRTGAPIQGLTVHPFAQPDAVPAIYSQHGALLLTSAFDPWPLVALQACANGLPIVASDRCGNREELFRGNAVVCPSGNVEAFAAAMLSVERGEVEGRAGCRLAELYDCREWTKRTLQISKELTA